MVFTCLVYSLYRDNVFYFFFFLVYSLFHIRFVYHYTPSARTYGASVVAHQRLNFEGVSVDSLIDVGKC